MSRLVKLERAFLRFERWADRVLLSPAGLAISISAVWLALWFGWIGPHL